MKRAILGDHTLMRDAYETFKLTIDAMGGNITAHVIRRIGPSSIKIEGGEVSFTAESFIMTREQLAVFDEEGQWQKILELCRQAGFSPTECE
jgi:hypothetical protein